MRVRATASILAAALSAGCGGAKWSLYEENDSVLLGHGTDRYYTQGLRVSALMEKTEHEDLAAAIDSLPGFEGALEDADAGPPPATETERRNERPHKVGYVFGQSFFTPSCIHTMDDPRNPGGPQIVCDPPDPHDRPYGGWLYVGVLDVRQKLGDARDEDVQISKEIDVGVVGESSLAHATQVSFHHLIDAKRPLGWKYQLPDEPGVNVAYDYRRRMFSTSAEERLGFDVIPTLLGSLGTIDTHAEVGAVARAGWELPRDFGVSTIQTTAVEGEVGGPDDAPFSLYLFGGLVGRAVLRNEFLDGNLFRNFDRDVDKRRLVGELRWGLAMRVWKLHVAYSFNKRSEEFRGQDGAQRWGSVQIGWCGDF